MLLREIKSIFQKELHELFAKEETNNFFYMLIEHFFGFERFVLAIDPNLIISKEQEKAMFAALADLKLERPIQHIIGHAHFMEMDFLVNENVLIPRPETEELVRWVMEEVQSKSFEVQSKDGHLKILDMGTGSGCIAVSLAKNIKNADVYAFDISNEALKIAKENSELNGVKIEFFQMDILNPKPLKMKFDIIVSNPPYIRELEKNAMRNNVKKYEPKMALFVPDSDPLLFYKAIIQFVLEHLRRDGALFLEINQYLGKETLTLLKDHNFSEIELRIDMFVNDRMIKGILKN